MIEGQAKQFLKGVIMLIKDFSYQFRNAFMMVEKSYGHSNFDKIHS